MVDFSIGEKDQEILNEMKRLVTARALLGYSSQDLK